MADARTLLVDLVRAMVATRPSNTTTPRTPRGVVGVRRLLVARGARREDGGR